MQLKIAAANGSSPASDQRRRCQPGLKATTYKACFRGSGLALRRQAPLGAPTWASELVAYSYGATILSNDYRAGLRELRFRELRAS